MNYSMRSCGEPPGPDSKGGELAAEQVLLGPFRAMEGLRVAFTLRDEAVFELMQFDAPSAFAVR